MMMQALKAAAQQQGGGADWSPGIVDVVSGGGSGGSPSSVAKYSGLEDGDVLLAFWSGFETTSSTWDASWIVVDAHGSATGAPDRSCKILQKVVTDAASEPSTYEPSSVSGSGAYGNTLTVVTIRDIDNTTPIDAFNTLENDIDAASPVCPSLTTATDGATVFAYAMTSTSNAVPGYVSNDNGGTLVADSHRDNGNFDVSHMIVSFVQGTAGATGDTTFTTAAAGSGWDWATTHVAVRPA